MAQAKETRETEQRTEREREVPVRREGRAGPLARREPFLPSPWAASPFEMMRRLTEDLDRFAQSVGFGRLGLAPFAGLGREPWAGPPALEPAAWAPQVEAVQRGDKLVIRADLPGLDKEEVSVELTEDGVLTISGERRQEAEDAREGYYRSERSYGRFFRGIPLPEGVEADQVEAAFKNGVLEITIPTPTREERRGRKVEIK